MATTEITPELVSTKNFQRTKFREGYNMDEVDTFLDDVAQHLRRLAGEPVIAQDDEPNAAAEVIAEEDVEPADASQSDAQQDVEHEESNPPAPLPDLPAEPPLQAAQELHEPNPTAPSLDLPSEPLGLLQAAQELHDKYVAEGIAERDRLIENARADHKQELDRMEEERAALQAELDQLEARREQVLAELRQYLTEQLDGLR